MSGFGNALDPELYPASYLISFCPPDTCARIMERREKNMVRHSIFKTFTVGKTLPPV